MDKMEAGGAPDSVENARWTLIRGARQLLTLRGASGPRRGSAMADLSIISDGAILIRDGAIEEVGTTRRVENLEPARRAREIDATGKVVMPAFVDPDIALACAPQLPNATGPDALPGETDIRRMSRHRLESVAAAIAADLARYGVLTAGAHTLAAPDLQNTGKALRLHRAMQSKPLRIRSVFAPPCGTDDECDPRRRQMIETWMAAVFKKKLASLLEIPLISGRITESRLLAEAAAATGYSIRFRVSGPVDADVLKMACSGGAVSVIGGAPEIGAASRSLADAGCVHIDLAARILAGDYVSRRAAIDDGTPVALGSGYVHNRPASLNPQFLLYLACHALGMQAEEAIVAATYNAACSLRLSHVTGSLAPGKSADICIMDVDDYRELARRAGHHDLYLAMRAGRIAHRRAGAQPE